MTCPLCELVGVERPARARGWCIAHYQQWRRGALHPEPIGEVRPQRTRILPDLLEIEGGTWTVEALAMRIGARPDTVRRQLTRLRQRGLVVRAMDGWRLKEI